MDVAETGSFADRSHPAMRGSSIESLSVAAQLDRAFVAFADGEIDRAAGARDQWDCCPCRRSEAFGARADSGELLDRGPTVTFEASNGFSEVIEVADQSLVPLQVRQGNFTWGDDRNAAFFPTGERLGKDYARYNLAIYDLFVIGHRKQLVWLGDPLRERLPPAGRAAAEQGWFEPSEELLGNTWPTPERARPYMELIQNGDVVPWDS